MTVPKPARLRVENLPTVFPNAGLDIGSAEIVAALPPDRAATVVRAFTTFTADLRELVTWLLHHQIDTVAMESTGVYLLDPPLRDARGGRPPRLSGQCAPLQDRAGPQV